MKFPTELTAPLLHNSYKELAQLDHKSLDTHLRQQYEPIQTICTWLDNNELPEDWMEVLFEYLEGLSQCIQITPKEVGYSISWPGYIDLQDGINRWFQYGLCTENQKGTRLPLFALALEKLVLQHPHSAFLMSKMAFTFLSDATGIEKRWQLKTEEELQAGMDFIHFILDLYLKGIKKCPPSEVQFVYNSLDFIGNNIRNLWTYNKPNKRIWKQYSYFLLTIFNSKAYLLIDPFVKGLFDENEPLVPIDHIPPKEQLLEQGKAQFEEKPCKATLFLLLNYLLRGIESTDCALVKSYVKQGANISNAAGILPIEQSLKLLIHFSPYSELISAYLSTHIQSDDHFFIVAKALNNCYDQIFSPHIRIEKKEVVQSIFSKIGDSTSNSEGQIEVKRLLVRWGQLSKEALPAKYRINAPDHLAQNINELKKLFKQLKLKTHVHLNKKASRKKINPLWPTAIQDIYLWANGCDLRIFSGTTSHDYLRTEINYTLEDHEEEAKGEELQFEFPQVDIRKHIHEEMIPIGINHSGHLFFVDPKACSKIGQPIVLRYHHDQMLTGRLEANSLTEFLSRIFIERCMEVYGPDIALKNLLATKVVL